MKRFSRKILKESYNRKLLKEAMENDRPLLRIYVGTYGKYNEGSLHGTWIDLPTSEENLKQQLQYVAQGEYDPEFMIQDYESSVGIEPSESENIFELNKIMQRVEDMADTDAGLALGVMLSKGYSFEEAINKVEDGDYHFIYIDDSKWNLEEALGMALVDEYGGIEQLDHDTLVDHFDYEGYGREEIINRNLEKVDGGYIEIY